MHAVDDVNGFIFNLIEHSTRNREPMFLSDAFLHYIGIIQQDKENIN